MKKGSVSSLNWWALAARGLMSNLFAVCFIVFPFVGHHVRIYLFSIFALIFGIFSVAPLAGHRLTWITFLELLQGVVSLAVGAAVFLVGVNDRTLFIILIAVWAITVGFLKYILSFLWGHEIPHRWVPKAGGIAAMAIGFLVLIFLFTDKNILAVSIWLSSFLFVYGLLILVFSFDLKALQEQEKTDQLYHPLHKPGQPGQFNKE